MGAALVLDAPATGFAFRYLKIPDFIKSLGLPKSASIGMGPQLDQERLDSAIARFEAACGPQCLAMAARATELEPGEVRWWRLRALLQCTDPLFVEEKPRTPDWLRVVDQCGGHDPDNALYDYIVASLLWDGSLTCSFSNGQMKLEVKDRQKFERGLQRFERGQKKGRCKIDESWCGAVVEFLGRSGVSPPEQVAIAESRRVQPRASPLLVHLCRTQQDRSAQQEQAGDPAGAIALLRQNLRCVEQFIQPEEPLALDIAQVLRRTTLTAIQALAEKHPGLLDPKELAAIKADAKAAILRVKVLVEAGSRLKKKRTGKPISMLAGLSVGIAAPTVAILLLGAAVCWLIGRYLRTGQNRPPELLGPYRHAIAWLTGYGLSIAALGMAPAEIIPVALQPWLAAALGGATVVAVLSWLVWETVPILKRRFGIRTWLGIVLEIVTALGLLTILGVVAGPSLSVPVPARAWEGGNVDVLQRAFSSKGGTWGGRWGWAVAQWCLAYPGAYVSLAIAITLLAGWYTLRRARAGGQPRPRSALRAYWAGLFACLRRSMLMVACGWLLAYLWLVPSVVQSADDAYQEKMAYYRNPHEYWHALRAAIVEVEADKEWLSGLRSDGS